MGDGRTESDFVARLSVTEKRSRLRPMGGGEAIDMALRLYQMCSWTVLRLTAVPMTLCYAALTFFVSLVVPGLFTTTRPGNSAAEAAEFVSALAIGLFLGVPLFALGYGQSSGITAHIVSDLLHGEEPDLPAAVRAGRRTTWAVASGLLVSLLQSLVFVILGGLLIALGSFLEATKALGTWGPGVTSLIAVLALGVGIIAFPVTLHSRLLTPVVAALESARARQAIQRSRRLMRNVKGHGQTEGVTIGAGLLLLFVGGGLWGTLAGLTMATGLPGRLTMINPFPGLGPLLSGLVVSLPGYVVLWLMTPIWTAAMTVLYIDRRIRLEAYDIQVMTEDIERASRRAVLLR